MLFGFRPSFECPQIPAFAGLRIDLARIQTVLSRPQFPNHGVLLSNKCGQLDRASLSHNLKSAVPFIANAIPVPKETQPMNWKSSAVVIALLALPLSVLGDDKPAAAAKPGEEKTQTLGILLYERFELLDVYGPAEVFGNLGKRLKVVTVAEKAGPVASTPGLKAVADYGFEDCPPLDLILVPGGIGTLTQLSNAKLHDWLRERSKSAQVVMSVCSGSAILAKAGLLDGKRATCNKQHFRTLTAGHKNVSWVKEARWVDEGDRVTSSGVSAGIDMALHMVARLYGDDIAQRVADGIEHEWQKDAGRDPFAKFAK
jgi:putative intracellular protease/amidase